MLAVSAQYQNGPLLLAGAYQQLELPVVSMAPLAFTGATGTREDLVLGAKYTVGAYMVASGYYHAKQPVPNSDSSALWLGGSVAMGPGTVLVKVQRLAQQAALTPPPRSTVLSLAYVYRLSRRTMLYASYGQSRNNDAGAFALVSNDAVAPGAVGAHVQALTLGINHSF